MKKDCNCRTSQMNRPTSSNCKHKVFNMNNLTTGLTLKPLPLTKIDQLCIINSSTLIPPPPKKRDWSPSSVIHKPLSPTLLLPKNEPTMMGCTWISMLKPPYPLFKICVHTSLCDLTHTHTAASGCRFNILSRMLGTTPSGPQTGTELNWVSLVTLRNCLEAPGGSDLSVSGRPSLWLKLLFTVAGFDCWYCHVLKELGVLMRVYPILFFVVVSALPLF